MDNEEAWVSLLQSPKRTLQKPAPEIFEKVKKFLEVELLNLPLAVEMAGCLLSRQLPLEELLDGFMSRSEMREQAPGMANALAVSGMVHVALDLLQHTPEACDLLQHTPEACDLLQHTPEACDLLQHTPEACDLAYMVAKMACSTVPLVLLFGYARFSADITSIESLENHGLCRLESDCHHVFMHPLTQGVLLDRLTSPGDRSTTRLQERVKENVYISLWLGLHSPSLELDTDQLMWQRHDVARSAHKAVMLANTQFFYGQW